MLSLLLRRIEGFIIFHPSGAGRTTYSYKTILSRSVSPKHSTYLFSAFFSSSKKYKLLFTASHIFIYFNQTRAHTIYLTLSHTHTHTCWPQTSIINTLAIVGGLAAICEPWLCMPIKTSDLHKGSLRLQHQVGLVLSCSLKQFCYFGMGNLSLLMMHHPSIRELHAKAILFITLSLSLSSWCIKEHYILTSPYCIYFPSGSSL